MFHGQRINLYFVIIKIYKLYGIFHFVCNTPPILLAREKIPAPLPTRGRQGGRCGLAGGGGGRAKRAQSRGRGPGGPPCPCFGLAGRGAGGPPAAKRRRPPGRCGFLLPYGSPPYFPSVTHHTSKAFWKPPKAVSKAEPFAALGEAPLTPFASPGAAHAPSAPHFRPATSQGSGGGAAPSRGPGARPPLAVAEPISISDSAPAFLSDLAQTLLLRHEKGPANAEPFGCRKSGLRHFSEVFIAPLRLRRGQGMQRNPCYARLFADLTRTPQGAFSCPFGTIHLVSPNPIIASGGCGPRAPRGFSTS